MTAEFTAQGDLGAAASGARATAENIRSNVRDYLARSKDKIVEMEEGLEGYVQEHPIRSILIAAGVGVVLGALIARR